KNHTARAKHRGSGSIGIIGAVRSALLVARDPDDADRRVIAPVKQNLCAPCAAVAFSVEPVGSAVKVVWAGETAHTADGLLVQPGRIEERMARTEAVEFLRAALGGGERPATDVLREASVLGIAEITLRRARKALGVQVRREGFGRDGKFLLALPLDGTDSDTGL